MTWAIEQEDLWAYGPDRSPSLGLVRVLRDVDGHRAVLVIEPADNPGASAVNAAEALMDEIQPVLNPIATFVCFPAMPDDGEWIELRRDARGGVAFERHAAALISGRLGACAQQPAADVCRCEQLAPGHLLLMHVRPVVEVPDVYEELAVVDVAALP